MFTETPLLETPLTETAKRAKGTAYYFGVDYHFLHVPLVKLNPAGTRRQDVLVNALHTLDLNPGIAWNEQLSLYVNLPLHVIQLPREAGKFSAGDATVFSRILLGKITDTVPIAIIPQAKLPTGNRSLYLSDSGLGYGALLAVEHDFKALSAAAHIGYMRSEHAIYRQIDYRQRVPAALGFLIPVASNWAVNLEGSGSVPLPIETSQNPGEVYLGARHAYNKELRLQAGLSIGSLNAVSSSDFRAIVALKFTPLQAALAKATP